MTTRPVGGMQSDELLHGFNKVLELKSFAELGQTPQITRAQVVVCFADIRRFTNLVERAQKAGGEAATELLCDFFSIFPKAVLREAWDLDHDGPRGDAFQKSIREHIFPSFWKRLGDGMLIVWDFTSVVDEQLKSGVKLAILDILGFVQEYFYKLVDLKNDKRIKPLNVELGIGLAKGEAWKLDFGVGGQIDYVGSPLNLAARLQDLARPGICVQAKFAPTYLVERTGTSEGKIEHLDIRGVDQRIPVWKSQRRTLWIRRPRTSCVDDDDFTIGSQFAIPPYEERPPAGTNHQMRRGISEADIESLLETRRKCEAHFASEAARLMTAHAGSELIRLLSRTKSIMQTATKEEFREIGQRFHEEIARLGGPKARAKERLALVQSLHEWTTKIYPEAQADRVKITEEHEAIVNAVLERLPDVAAERMREHLKEHNARVMEEALAEPITK